MAEVNTPMELLGKRVHGTSDDNEVIAGIVLSARPANQSGRRDPQSWRVVVQDDDGKMHLLFTTGGRNGDDIEFRGLDVDLVEAHALALLHLQGKRIPGGDTRTVNILAMAVLQLMKDRTQ